jgi:hypothetical protein
MFKFKITLDRHNAIQNLMSFLTPLIFCYHLPLTVMKMALLMPLSKMTQKVSLLSLFPANLRITGEDAAVNICHTYFLYISLYCCMPYVLVSV